MSEFEGDAFISYAHLDNIGLPGRKGWVAGLQQALEIRVAQLRGCRPRIFWDPHLSGNNVFAQTLCERLQRVSTLISVVSPPYIKSEWTLRELHEFCAAAEQQGGVHVRDKSRLFKVLKRPVAREEQPPALRPLLGYEFYRVEPETGRVRELDGMFGADAEREYWLRLDDLAHDLCELLEVLERQEAAAPPAGEAVFLADTTNDLRTERDTIRRGLQQRGYRVLPMRALPLTAAEAAVAIREDLAHCRMSIHLFGRNYSLVPEGGTTSLLELQNELAIERAAEGGFSRLGWIPSGIAIQDERQQALIDRLRVDPRFHQDADLLETSLEDLQTVIEAWLRRDPRRRGTTAPARPEAVTGQVYLVYDRRDQPAVAPWADFLHDQGFDVVPSFFDGDEAEIREFHDWTLQTCDGVLIFYGLVSQIWLRRKLAEIQKSAGYGRTKAMPEVAICLAPPEALDKQHFRTNLAMVIRQAGAFSGESLQPFIDALKVRARGSRADVA